MARLFTLAGVRVSVADEKVEARLASGSYFLDDPTDDGWVDGPPPGNGSRSEWASYADSLGVEYDPDAKRDDIKAAVAAAEAG